jgi:hypothetical protein
MDSDQLEKSRKSGEKVWNAIQNQVAEGGGFVGAMFGSFKTFVKKHFFSFLLFGIVGALIAAGIWFLKPKIYEAEMTVSYVHYEKKIYADMLEKLDMLVESKSYTSLSNLLGLPEEIVSKLRGIKGYNIRNEELIEDLSTEKIPFYVVVEVTDISILDALQEAIVNYLDGSEFIQDRLAYMKQKSEDELEFLEHRLSMVDSLGRFLILQEDKMLNEKTVSRMELLEETMAIYSKIQDVKGSLAFNLNIEVLDGFIANEKPSGKGIIFWVLYGFLAGLGLRFLVLIFK